MLGWETWSSIQKKLYKDSTRNYDKLFTRRELEVVVLLSKGMTNIEISKLLCADVKTIEHHVNSIYHKCIYPKWANPRVWIAVNINKILSENNGGH